MIEFKAEVNPRDLARITNQLDKWKGRRLALVMSRIERAALSLALAPIKARAAKHNRTGATQRGFLVRKLPLRAREVSAWKLESNTPWAHFVQAGTKYITADPYIADVRRSLKPQMVSFIEQQVRRLT